ncbi:aspartate/glutamate racemase family protein [Bacillus solitudinis]|uniref:aspartate/glutamate racemase family protein n=1 Tax=Bacillus solitudinis TaxID=2014074 RepID=UPI000C23DE90|nr:aspartate/glutamate racemase family protein [Bacillus solitudinis]
MTKILAIYTGQGIAENVQKLFSELIPDAKVHSIIDDSLISEVITEGKVTPSVKKRLIQYYQHGVEINADIILNTCSSVGEVASVAREFIDVPIVKIDELMAQKAVEEYKRIGVIATLPSTLKPTMRLVQAKAEEQGKEVTVVDGLAKGAYLALVGGEPDKHDQLIFDAAKSIADEVDVFVLAQGSMARMEEKLKEMTGKPVMSSPYLGVLSVKKALGK